MMKWLIYGIIGLLTLVPGIRGEEGKADLVLKNGRIATIDPARPQAAAVAVRGDRILAVGTDTEVGRYIDRGTQVIDLQGKFVMPGFIDSHGHFGSLGYTRMQLDLTRARSWEEIVEQVRTAVAAAHPGDLIQGRGWHQEKWEKPPVPSVQGLPLHDQLSAASPDNPVILTHASGHSCLANARAMKMAGITAASNDPAGGEIVRQKSGEPIGAFLETAQDLLHAAMRQARAGMTPAQRLEQEIRAIDLAAEECLLKGVTSFHDAGVSFAGIDLYKSLAQQGKLKVRINAMIGESNESLRKRIGQYRIMPVAGSFLTVHTVKRLIDGALGAHGAWLFEPYESLPSSKGLNTESVETMRETAVIAIENGFQLSTHAIGDRANRETLDIYEAAFHAHPEKKDLRWRIEHAQHLHPSDIPRFAGLGVIASMQGVHCTSDGPWVLRRLGEKRAAEGAYVWRKLLDSGARICNGTDVPVEAVDPIPCFYASVARKLKNGERFFPDQRMSREEALRTYTVNGAFAAFEENQKGILKPGYLADIVVLSADLLTIPEEKIPDTYVLLTIVGGKILYKK